MRVGQGGLRVGRCFEDWEEKIRVVLRGWGSWCDGGEGGDKDVDRGGDVGRRWWLVCGKGWVLGLGFHKV